MPHCPLCASSLVWKEAAGGVLPRMPNYPKCATRIFDHLVARAQPRRPTICLLDMIKTYSKAPRTLEHHGAVEFNREVALMNREKACETY